MALENQLPKDFQFFKRCGAVYFAIFLGSKNWFLNAGLRDESLSVQLSLSERGTRVLGRTKSIRSLG